MQINLSEQQKSNLIEFLRRTSLRGHEVSAFNELILLLNKKEEKEDDGSIS